MSRYSFAVFLLLGSAAFAQEPARDRSNPAATSTRRPPAAGYIITPSGMVVFPDAPPPAGDTSTLSGAGPSVSTGPVVGPGPEVSAGPVVGRGP